MKNCPVEKYREQFGLSFSISLQRVKIYKHFRCRNRGGGEAAQTALLNAE